MALKKERTFILKQHFDLVKPRYESINLSFLSRLCKPNLFANDELEKIISGHLISYQVNSTMKFLSTTFKTTTCLLSTQIYHNRILGIPIVFCYFHVMLAHARNKRKTMPCKMRILSFCHFRVGRFCFV